MNTYGQSRGRGGSYSTNWQLTGRDLLDSAEVRLLDNQYALLFIRGERPVQDDKYDVMKHPAIKLTTDGGGEPYVHGEDVVSIADFDIDERVLKKAQEIPVDSDEYVFLSEEELEELIKQRKEKLNEKENNKQH